MILLLPIGLLLIASLAIFVLSNIKPKYGTSWLIAAVAAIIAWLTISFLRLRLPTRLPILTWRGPSTHLWGEFSLLLDYSSWPYALALITITLAVILTDAARTHYDSTPKSWSVSLAISSLGLISILSGTCMMLIATWVIVDILELIYLLGIKGSSQISQRIVGSYGIRIASLLTLILASVRNWQLVGTTDLTQISQGVGFLFLLAAGLRLGVFPLNFPFQQEPGLRRGVGNIIRLAPVAASMSLLSRLPSEINTANLSVWIPIFHVFLLIAALYSSLRWLTASDAIDGRTFWIIGWSAFAAASVLNGVPNASLSWGTALILPGSLLFLYFPRIQRMNFLLYFGLIGLVGLPFTPAASGWAGLVSGQFSLWTILYLMIHALMVLGYLRRILQPGDETSKLESWARLVYPLGLIIIIQAIIAIGLIGWPGSLTMGVWWLAAASLLLVAAAFFILQRVGIDPANIKLPSSSPLNKILDRILPWAESVFRLEWLYQLAWQILKAINTVLHFFSTIIEGEGGILWTLLFLVLLISLITTIGAN